MRMPAAGMAAEAEPAAGRAAAAEEEEEAASAAEEEAARAFGGALGVSVGLTTRHCTADDGGGLTAGVSTLVRSLSTITKPLEIQATVGIRARA